MLTFGQLKKEGFKLVFFFYHYNGLCKKHNLDEIIFYDTCIRSILFTVSEEKILVCSQRYDKITFTAFY